MQRLLLESGAIAKVAVARPLGERALILSRALTRLRIYRAPALLNFSQRAQAARAYAEAHAPFANTGALILRTKRGAEIWYWDRSKLAALEPLGQVSPESVWRTPGEGWRIVRCEEGLEAQYWEAGCLCASTWRRQDFGVQQWRTFVLSVANPAIAAPAEPPPAETLAMTATAWRWRVVASPLTWRDLERACWTLVMCAAAVTALLCGQAMRSSALAERESARVEAAEQTLRSDPELAAAIENYRLINDYARATASTYALIAATEAHEALARFGLRADTWRVSDGQLSVIVDGALGETPVRDVVRAFDEAKHLCAALPEIAGAGRFEIRASVTGPDAPCATTRAGAQG
ncbi:MAG: hypothetical protein M0D54_11855 [Hyphomonadaceae bacterium JAD_PAG50586_4]|nr:MAG: hypothetical protein M0D54_11855 [Hyphomonadaceae bacterium JAD_PAG50586_4]